MVLDEIAEVHRIDERAFTVVVTVVVGNLHGLLDVRKRRAGTKAGARDGEVISRLLLVPVVQPLVIEQLQLAADASVGIGEAPCVVVNLRYRALIGGDLFLFGVRGQRVQLRTTHLVQTLVVYQIKHFKLDACQERTVLVVDVAEPVDLGEVGERRQQSAHRVHSKNVVEHVRVPVALPPTHLGLR
jgi:hypothetical protein